MPTRKNKEIWKEIEKLSKKKLKKIISTKKNCCLEFTI